MLRRILILLRARLASQRSDAKLPFAALLIQAFIASAVCGLVRGEIPPFAYALVALSSSAALIAVPLLGELASLLVADETGDWVRALPIRAVELHIARTMHLALALLVLSLGSLVPAALLADARFDAWMRVELVVLGLGQALAIAAVLLALQAVLRGRAQPLLVLAQTALFIAILVGSSVGLRKVPAMVGWNDPSAAGALLAYPPAWFAARLSSSSLGTTWNALAPAVSVLAVVLLALLPAPPTAAFRRGEPLLGRLLAPLRRLCARIWVRPDERASYEWLFDALPKERDFVLRTYPLLAVPVGFLWISARAGSPVEQMHWLAMLLFIPGVYLPLIAAHVPASTSHKARWIVDCAPLERDALDRGAIKALAVRMLVPFYALLAALGCLLGGAGLVARLVLPAGLASVIVLRATWRVCVTAPPLSTSPDELYVNRDWIGMLGVIAVVLSALAIAASKWIDSPWKALVFALAMLALERVTDRRGAARTLSGV